MRFLFLLIPIFGFSQTVVDWNTGNIVVGSFVPSGSPNATVTITGSNFNNLQGASPRYNSGGSSNWALNGLGLGVDFPNTSSVVVVDIVFTTPPCGDLTFDIHDIDGSTSNLIFEDKVTIDTWDQNNAAIPVNATNFVFGNSSFCGGPLYFGGNNLLNTQIGRCQNGAYNGNSYGSVAASVPVTLKSPTNKIKRVRITYGCAKNAPDINAYYSGTNPDYENIVIGNFTLIPPVLTPPTIAGTPSVCPGSSTTLTAGGFSNYSWNTGQSTAAISVSPASATTYTVTGTNAAGCTAVNSVNVSINPTPAISANVNDNAICTGQSINLSSNPTLSSSTTSHTFEASNPFYLVNGTRNNWYRGTFAKCTGTYGLYIGTASGNNNYVNYASFTQQPAVNFAYIDIPITLCNATLSFNWKCLGKVTDNLSVWLVPTSTTLVAGTALVNGGSILKVGGDYWNSGASCNSVANINLVQGWVTPGQTIRLVFQWRNIGNAGSNTAANPAAMIDDIVITQTETNSYSWISSATAFTSSNQNPTDSPSISTTYTLTATNCLGCTSNVSSLSVTVDPCPTPIELISFTGQCQNRDKQFNWSTASEHNNDFFTLEHSRNGSDFYPMQAIDGAGNSTSLLNYSTHFTEEDETFVYYRLKQTDTDGATSYSDVIYVSCREFESDLMTVFPNPSNDLIVVSFNSSISEDDYLISITDMVGKSVLDRHVAVVKNGTTVLDVSSFSNGYYFLRLIDKNSGEQLDIVRFSKID